MSKTFEASANRLMLAFGTLSLAAILAGAAVVVLTQDAGPGVAIRDLIAWGLGALAASGLAFGLRRPPPSLLAWIAPLGLLATLFAPGLESVHRWVALGSLQANVAMLLLPFAVVAAAGESWSWRSAAPLLVAMSLLAWQPDASQATALAAAIVVLAFASGARRLLRYAPIAWALAMAAWAWIRPDPLAPEPEVEGVIGLAWGLSPLAAIGVFGLLLGVAGSPALARPGRAGLALIALLLGWSLTPFLGAFPVPFAGLSPSPILGAWLGVGLLAARLRAAG